MATHNKKYKKYPKKHTAFFVTSYVQMYSKWNDLKSYFRFVITIHMF